METIHTKILLVEDDQALAGLTRDYLQGYGYQVEIEENGLAAIDAIINRTPDLVILDLMLPDVDGIEVCRRVREHYHHPILMLTARGDQIDHILGLEMGADDYIVKPVEPRLLLARVKALLRRTQTGSATETEQASAQRLVFDNLVIDNGARSVTLSGEEVILSSPQYDLIWLLAQNAGQVLSREDIFTALRGIDYDGLNRTIDINISHIRNKLHDDAGTPKRIKTIRNKGYMFVKNIS